MEYPRNFARHARLVGRMADALGVDLEEKTLRAELAPEALDGAINRCQGCDDLGGCQSWLSTQTSTADAPPPFCRNIEFFKLLS